MPIPEQASADGEKIEAAIKAALEECDTQGIKGKMVTPFVLERINQMSGGKSLESNLALVENNARAGARIAVELSSLRGRQWQGCSTTTTSAMVFGGCNFDTIWRMREDISLNGSALQGKVETAAGGEISIE